ncbi:MAG: extracellular solute-binding protein [Clostridia bacterium]
MRKFGMGLCWVALLLLMLLVIVAAGRLPASNEGAAARMDDPFAGVLRVWVHGGWSPGSGSFVPWLNARAARFEKRHPGVYVQVERVSDMTLAAFGSGDVNPPDAILFPPGLLDGADGLLPLAARAQLTEAIADAGRYGEALYALPVAMGGYAWALNRKWLEDVPLNWAALDPPPPAKKRARFLLQAPSDGRFLSWSGALNALCAPRSRTRAGFQAEKAGEGLDLGLPDDPRATQAPTPMPETELVLCDLPPALPADFRKGDTAYAAFTGDVAAAIPVTQREIRRLQVLSEMGRGPDWTIAQGGAAFTDQLLMMAVVDAPRPDAQARKALALSLLDFLLTEDSQAQLSLIRALRVTKGPALYGSQRGMAELEAIYRGGFSSVNAFDDRFRAQQAAQADRLQAGT